MRNAIMEKPEVLLENYRKLNAILRPMCKSKRDHMLVNDFINDCRKKDIEMQKDGLLGSYSGGCLFAYSMFRNMGEL